jgi:NitT/TauT family transport system permease protein
MYAAIASIIVLAVLFLNLLERLEGFLFKGTRKTLVSD